MRIQVCALWLGLLSACSSELRSERPSSEAAGQSEGNAPLGRPSYAPQFAPSPPEVPDEAPPAPTPPVVEAPCEIERVTVATKKNDGKVQLSAHLRSRASRSLTVAVRGVCPGGAARFSGLPDGYDYFATCNKGVCAEPTTEATRTLEPGETWVLDSVTLNPRGARCQPALDRVAYAITFEAEIEGAVVCGGEAASLDLSPPVRMPARPIRQPVLKLNPDCPPSLDCGLACPGGQLARGVDGCLQCACERNAIELAPQR